MIFFKLRKGPKMTKLVKKVKNSRLGVQNSLSWAEKLWFEVQRSFLPIFSQFWPQNLVLCRFLSHTAFNMICNNCTQQLDEVSAIPHTWLSGEHILLAGLLHITYNHGSKIKRMYKRRSNSHVISRGKMMGLINIGGMFDLIWLQFSLV